MIDYSKVETRQKVKGKGYFLVDTRVEPNRLILDVRLSKRPFAGDYQVEILNLLGKNPQPMERLTTPSNSLTSERVMALLESLVCPYCEEEWGPVCGGCIEGTIVELTQSVQEMEKAEEWVK